MTEQLTLKNSLSKISFCNKECFNINNNKTKEKIINHIQEKYNLQIIDKQYVLINPHMVKNITFHEHLVSTFTNGNPYLLYLTQIDGINCSIFIDRKLKNGYSYPKIHCVQYRFDNELFEKDTMFTGELVRDKNHEWLFLISDLLIFEGNLTKTKNVLSRFQLIHKILDNYYTKDEDNEICPLYIKKLFQYNQIAEIFNEFMPSLSYICKGIVFYTLNSQFSNYAWITPRDNQIQVMNEEDLINKFFEKYPNYLQYKDVLINNNGNINVNSLLSFNNNMIDNNMIDNNMIGNNMINNNQNSYIDNTNKDTNNTDNNNTDNSNTCTTNTFTTNTCTTNTFTTNTCTTNTNTNNKNTITRNTNDTDTNNSNDTNNINNINNFNNYNSGLSYQNIKNNQSNKNQQLNINHQSNKNNILDSVKPNQAVLTIVKTNTPDIYHLFCLNDDINKVGIAFIPNINISHMLYDEFNTNSNNKLKVICNYQTFFGKWIPCNFTNLEVYDKEKCFEVININVNQNN